MQVDESTVFALSGYIGMAADDQAVLDAGLLKSSTLDLVTRYSC